MSLHILYRFCGSMTQNKNHQSRQQFKMQWLPLENCKTKRCIWVYLTWKIPSASKMTQEHENQAHNQWNADKHTICITVQVQANAKIPIFQMKQQREYWWAERNYSCYIWPWQHKRSSARLGFLGFFFLLLFFPFLFLHCSGFTCCLTAGKALLWSTSWTSAQNKGCDQLQCQPHSCISSKGFILCLKAK